MSTLLLVFVFLTSLIITLVLTKIFIKYNLFDAINHRSVHKSKATKTGGISIFLTLFIFSLFFYITKDQIFDFSLLIPLGIMFIVGVYDDFYNADFKLKFLIQIIVAKIIICMNGLFNFANSRVGRSTASKIITPPIVGVPFFFRCDLGPVGRISSPIWFLCSMWITQGPIMKLITNADIAANAERKVIYSNKLKNENLSIKLINI